MGQLNINPSIPQHIFLVGYGGAGKTTVGRLIVQKTGLKFYDCSFATVRRMKMKTLDMLSVYGISGYCDFGEQTLLNALAPTERRVIILYFGNIVSPVCRALLQRNGMVFYLFAPLETLKERRCRRERMRSNMRKLWRYWMHLQSRMYSVWLKMRIREKAVNADAEQKIREEWAKWEEGDDRLFRQCAHCVIDTTKLDMEQVAAEIIERANMRGMHLTNNAY